MVLLHFVYALVVLQTLWMDNAILTLELAEELILFAFDTLHENRKIFQTRNSNMILPSGCEIDLNMFQTGMTQILTLKELLLATL